MKRKIVACVCLIAFIVGCSWMADLLIISVHGSAEVNGRKDQDIPPTKKKLSQCRRRFSPLFLSSLNSGKGILIENLFG